MTDPVPAHSIDRKLQALAKRIAAEKQPPRVMERPPTDGLTSTVLTPRKPVAPTLLTGLEFISLMHYFM